MAFWRTTLAALTVFASVSGAQAACDLFPKSNFLGDYTHEQVKSYVNKAHGGDWSPYLAKLKGNLARLEMLQSKGDGAILNVRGKSTDVSPSELTRFVYVSRQWMSIAQCLSSEQTVASLDNFATAAGSNHGDGEVHYFNVPDARTLQETALGSLDNEVASLSINPVKLDITSRCVAGDTIFTVTNVGKGWPAIGTFGIYRVDGPNKQMISGRRMIMDAGEVRKFKISKRQNLTGQLGIAVQPSWYVRPFEMDGGATCK